ncbi:hypothetical protein SAMN02910418_02417 [Bowdeniella nasicola]|uniref:Alpha/beta hydrolase n=1 Tax=Bowdeniella nasicola TaxID=208480 RepID=A0A1H4E1A6_9ACTO|nr:hypothetical protein [Bowdeniella nasicola]SEA78823.1 hypothetical protein SAMN02910418_02417 [Bowdeniella nasicola]
MILRRLLAAARRARGATRDIGRDLVSSLPHWRDWSADYRSLAMLRLRAPLDRLAARLAGAGPLPPQRRLDIVVLPGIYETAADLRELTRPLARRGHTIHRVPRLYRQLAPMAVLRASVERFLAERELSDVVLLAHSKGGLIGKEVMMGAQGARVRGMVALATPWHGSAYAALFWPGLGVRSLRPGSPLIAAAQRPHPSDARIVSIHPSFDPHIPLGSRLPGSRNIAVPTPGHFAVLSAPPVIDAVEAAVASMEAGDVRDAS